MTSASTTVIKAGGSLLGSAADLERVALEVAARRRRDERVVLVVSALSGVTDLLESELWRAAARYPHGDGARLADQLVERHEELARGIRASPAAVAEAGRLAFELEALLYGDDTKVGLSRRRQARALSYGERMSAPLVAAAVRAAGAEARAVTAEELGLRAAGPRYDGSCELEESRAGVVAIAPELAERVLVVTGFYGHRENGEVVLFGRGGSDYTAGALAALVGAERLEFWKDLPGYFTANPKRMAEARRVPELSFREAALLGRYGARILHPRCLEPVWDLPIRVAVGLPADPFGGTRLVRRTQASEPCVQALAVRAPRTVVRVNRRRPGSELRDVGRMLDELESARFALDRVAVSSFSLCFSVVDDRPYDISGSLRSLNGPGHPAVSIRQFPAWIGVVGQAVAADGEIAAAVAADLAAEGGPHSEAMPLGDSALRCRVERQRLTPVLRALHRRFFG